jgi:hypothetical protein
VIGLVPFTRWRRRWRAEADDVVATTAGRGARADRSGGPAQLP